MKSSMLVLAILLMSLVFFPATMLLTSASFTVPPTFDLTTTSNIAGATNAVYTIHCENPDPFETAISFSIVVPAGYFVDPSYITTTPGITVMTGYCDLIGDYSPPYLGTIEIKTTTTSGVFEGFLNGVSKGVVNLVLPTPTTPGSLGGVIPGLNNGIWGEVHTVPGFFINPPAPGIYTWGPNSATPSSGPTVTMNPRPSKTNQITIVGTFVTIDVPFIDVAVGSVFEVPISIRNLPRAMDSFDLLVTWNPGLVELIDVVENGEKEGRLWDTYYSNPPWNGIIFCYGDGVPWLDDSAWFTLRFRCIGKGTSTIKACSPGGSIHLVDPPGVVISEYFAIYCRQHQAVGGSVLSVGVGTALAWYIALMILGIAAPLLLILAKKNLQL